MKFNSFQMKLFMMCLMVLDHLSFIPNVLPFEVLAILHLITRPVAVWFTFSLVEGFLHTSNRFAYCTRLLYAALFMVCGNTLLMAGLNLPITPTFPNIFLSLALSCLLLIVLYDDDKRLITLTRGVRLFIATLLFLVCFLFAEGTFIVPTLTLLFYKTHDDPKKRNMWLAVLSVLMLMIQYPLLTLTFGDNVFSIMYGEWFYISVIPFLYLYNSQKGPSSTFSKYVFYIFYPVHLWVLVMLGSFL